MYKINKNSVFKKSYLQQSGRASLLKCSMAIIYGKVTYNNDFHLYVIIIFLRSQNQIKSCL